VFRYMLKSKIHRAVVTDADLNYVGSITLDEELMEAAHIIENEKVTIVNNNNGERFETYVITGERGSKTVCLNGAAARKVQRGDVVIILTYTIMDDKECKDYKPALVYVNEKNEIQKISSGSFE